MKKKILTILFAVLLFALLSVTAFAYNLGDVDGSGNINAIDARLALRYSARLNELTEEQIAAADVDASGKVNAIDARMILRVAAKLDAPFEKVSFDGLLIEDGVLNVAILEDNAPFSYYENGVLKGIDVDIVKRIADSAELELKLHPMSYEEQIEAVNNGTCDIATSGNSLNFLVYSQMAQSKSYYNLTLCIVVAKTSDITSCEQIKGNSDIKVGVLSNLIDEYIIRRDFDDENIVTFSNCRDAVKALENGDIDVFISNADYAVNMSMYNSSVECFWMNGDNYYEYNHVMFTSKRKPVLIEKVNSLLSSSYVSETYDKIDIKTSIFAFTDNVILAPGGTACVEIFAQSFFTDDPGLYVKSDECSASICEADGKTYLIISAPENAVGKSVTVFNSYDSASATITVSINKNIQTEYEYYHRSYVLDFGAFTGTDPIETVIDSENKAVVHTYLVYDLWENGYVDSTILDEYLTALENEGYVYVGYEEIENTVALGFVNEKRQQVVTYVEAYDEEGYIVAVGIGYILPDSIFD